MNGFYTAEFELVDFEVDYNCSTETPKSQRFQSAWKSLAGKALAVSVAAEAILIPMGFSDEIDYHKGPALAASLAAVYGLAYSVQKRRNEALELTTRESPAPTDILEELYANADVIPIHRNSVTQFAIAQVS